MDVHGQVGAGELNLLDHVDDGVQVDSQIRDPGSNATGVLHLDLSIGLGTVRVLRQAADLLSLITGGFFTAAGTLLLFDRVDLVVRLRWAWPLLLIIVALLILAATTPWRRTWPAPAEPAAPDSLPGRTSDEGAE